MSRYLKSDGDTLGRPAIEAAGHYMAYNDSDNLVGKKT